RELGRDVPGAAGLAVADEAHQVPALGGQLEPQRPPHHQVLPGRSAQRAHGAPPGHGRASTRSAFSSTLAYTLVASWLRCRSTCPTSGRDAPARSISVASE